MTEGSVPDSAVAAWPATPARPATPTRPATPARPAVWVGRAEHQGALFPGSVHQGVGLAHIPWGGQTYTKDKYQVSTSTITALQSKIQNWTKLTQIWHSKDLYRCTTPLLQRFFFFCFLFCPRHSRGCFAPLTRVSDPAGIMRSCYKARPGQIHSP